MGKTPFLGPSPLRADSWIVFRTKFQLQKLTSMYFTGRYNHRKGPKRTEKDRKGTEKELLMYYSPKRRRKVGNGTQGDGKQIIKGNKKVTIFGYLCCHFVLFPQQRCSFLYIFGGF